MDMGQYFLDCLFFLLGWPSWQRLTAFTFRGMPTGLQDESQWEVEDHLTLLAMLEGGISLQMDTSARALQHWRWAVRVHGEKGSIVLDKTTTQKAFHLEGDFIKQHVHRHDLVAAKTNSDLARRLDDLRALIAGEAREYGTTARESLLLTDFCLAAYESSEAKAEVSKGVAQ